MNEWYYIKVYYKGGYIHYYLTNDLNFYKRDKDVAKIEFLKEQEIFNPVICND